MPSCDVLHVVAKLRSVWLAGGVPPPRPTFSEDEVETARREEYQRGVEETTRLLEGQLLELRTEAVRMQSETFVALVGEHEALAQEFRAMLPEFAMEAVTRLLAGTPIERETVLRIVAEMLSEVEPGKEIVEVELSARDLELIAGHDADFRAKHPAIAFTSKPELLPGDCMVRTRFGALDGRMRTKRETLEGVLRG